MSRERGRITRFIAARILSESDSPPRRSSIYEAGEGANRNDKPFESRSSVRVDARRGELYEESMEIRGGIVVEERRTRRGSSDRSISRQLVVRIEKQWSILLGDFREFRAGFI